MRHHDEHLVVERLTTLDYYHRLKKSLTKKSVKRMHKGEVARVSQATFDALTDEEKLWMVQFHDENLVVERPTRQALEQALEQAAAEPEERARDELMALPINKRLGAWADAWCKSWCGWYSFSYERRLELAKDHPGLVTKQRAKIWAFLGPFVAFLCLHTYMIVYTISMRQGADDECNCADLQPCAMTGHDDANPDVILCGQAPTQEMCEQVMSGAWYGACNCGQNHCPEPEPEPEPEP
eukprot:COSAG04_NODE_34_length_34523_cov_40.302446_28_plen_239_part_00